MFRLTLSLNVTTCVLSGFSAGASSERECRPRARADGGQGGPAQHAAPRPAVGAGGHGSSSPADQVRPSAFGGVRARAKTRSVNQRLRVGGARVDAERGEVREDPARQRAVDLAGQQAELLGLGVARAGRAWRARPWSGSRSTAPGAAGSTSCGSPRRRRARRTSRGGSRRAAARCRPSRTAARAPARGRPRTPPRRPACRARTRSPACAPARSRRGAGRCDRALEPTRSTRAPGSSSSSTRAHTSRWWISSCTTRPAIARIAAGASSGRQVGRQVRRADDAAALVLGQPAPTRPPRERAGAGSSSTGPACATSCRRIEQTACLATVPGDGRKLAPTHEYPAEFRGPSWTPRHGCRWQRRPRCGRLRNRVTRLRASTTSFAAGAALRQLRWQPGRWPAGVPAPGPPGRAGRSARRSPPGAGRRRGGARRAAGRAAARRRRRARRARRRAPAGTAPTRARRGSRPRSGPGAPPGAAPRPPRGGGAPSGARGRPRRARAPRRSDGEGRRRPRCSAKARRRHRARSPRLRGAASSAAASSSRASAWRRTPCACAGSRSVRCASAELVEDLLRRLAILLGRQPVAIGVEAARQRLVGAVDVGGGRVAPDVQRPEVDPACGPSAASSTAGRSRAARWWAAARRARPAPAATTPAARPGGARPSCAVVVSWRWIIPASDSATSSRRALSRGISARSRITSSWRAAVDALDERELDGIGRHVLQPQQRIRRSAPTYWLRVLLQRRLLARLVVVPPDALQDRRRGRALERAAVSGGARRRP